jgi:phosphoglycolate phosphatase-like HAD superfamily hydrolase
VRAGAEAIDQAVIVLGDTVHDLAGARAVGLPFLGTGAMGLRRDDVPEGATPPAAWVADLGDAEAVLAAVERCLAG